MELFLRFATGPDLPFDRPAVLQFPILIDFHLSGEQSYRSEGDEKQAVLRQRHGRIKLERAKKLGKDGAKGGGQSNLPALENGADEKHGEEVKEAEIDVALDNPIDKGE